MIYDVRRAGEALRSGAAATFAPPQLSGAADSSDNFIVLQDSRVRFITCGHGPALVLLHALGTQLDVFQNVIPRLAEGFRVYALDYPGHGRSDAPEANYSAEFLTGYVAEFLERLDIKDAILVGESIGATMALLLTARHNPRVRGVVAVNAYDYDRGRGLRRSSLSARLFTALLRMPLVHRLFGGALPSFLLKRILLGGVFRKESLPAALLHELHAGGLRPGHRRAFEQLVRNWRSWDRARDEYGKISLPVQLVYGENDWSTEFEREDNRRTIPRARTRFLNRAGHFAALDAPDAFVDAILEYTARLSAAPRRRRILRKDPAHTFTL
jgi:pimeloyl-ACP methyl ester carboxylesterase